MRVLALVVLSLSCILATGAKVSFPSRTFGLRRFGFNRYKSHSFVGREDPNKEVVLAHVVREIFKNKFKSDCDTQTDFCWSSSFSGTDIEHQRILIPMIPTSTRLSIPTDGDNSRILAKSIFLKWENTSIGGMETFWVNTTSLMSFMPKQLEWRERECPCCSFWRDSGHQRILPQSGIRSSIGNQFPLNLNLWIKIRWVEEEGEDFEELVFKIYLNCSSF